MKLLSVPKTVYVTLIAESLLLGNQMAEHTAEGVVCIAKRGGIYHRNIERGLARIGVTQWTARLTVEANEVAIIKVGMRSNPDQENAFHPRIGVAGKGFFP
jgi:hypothetical protein